MATRPTFMRVSRSRLLAWSTCMLYFMACNPDEDLVYQSQINRWEYISEKNGLASNYVNTIFEDSNGKFWIGTDRGVSVLSEKTIESYSTLDGLLDNNVYSVGEDKDGRIWVGTRKGLNVLVDGRWLYFTYFYGASVQSLLQLQGDEGILIGTGGYGIYRFSYTDNNFTEFYRAANCDDCNSINALFQSSDGSVWAASFKGALKIRGNFVTQFDEGDGLAGSIVTSIAEDRWGNIWLGTVEGKTISKVNGNTITQVSFNNGADQNFIFGIQEDHQGNLWVGTVGNGLFHYDGAVMTQIYKGPPDNTITTLRKDTDGNLWMGTSEEGVAIYITHP